jgi:hypothetical protein
MNPYVFLVGCARSGTTLLQRLVDAHPRLAVLRRETHWITDYFREKTGLTADCRATCEVIRRLFDHRTFRLLGLSRGQVEALLGPDRTAPYADFVSRLFDLYGRARVKPLVGDKTPAYCREIGLLHALWPQGRFVHLIRDGRDVCLSALAWKKVEKLKSLFPTWAEEPVATAALWWEWHVRRGREGGWNLPPGLYHEVRYEDLVHRPGETCRKLCCFLDLPYDPAMLGFHEGHAPRPGRDAKHAWLPVTPGLRDWRTQMAATDVEHFEAVAGPLLDELGYPRGTSRPTLLMQKQANRLREQFRPEAVLRRSALSDP